MTDVFISYSRKDKAFVQRLFSTLEAQGHDAWVDWDDIEYAEDWWRKIQAGIEGADSFVFIISPSSVRSTVCYDEVQHADDNHKRIVPVVIEDVTEAADIERMHPALKRQNWLFFRPDDDFDAMLVTLLETLRREPEHVQMHTRLLVNAHEWEANAGDASLALRGENLQRAQRWLAQVEGKSPTPSALHRAYISASQKAEQRRRQRSGLIGAVVVVVLAVIALVAFSLFQQTQSDQQIQASLDQADLASTPFAAGDMFNALALAVDANQQIAAPPEKSLSLLREIAAAPGPIALFSSDGAVTSVAFSPDRSRIVSAHADGSLKLWDATQGVGSYDTPLYTTSDDMLHVESIASVAIGPQGRFVVSVGCFARDPENSEADNNCIQPEINFWEIVDDAFVQRHHFTNPENMASVRGAALDVAFTANSDSGTIEVIEAASRPSLFTSPDTPALLRYSFTDPAQIDDFWFGSTRIYELPSPLTAVSVGADGEIVAGDAAGNLAYQNGNIRSQLRGRVNDLLFSPSANYAVGARRFLAASEGGMLQLYSPNGLISTWDQGADNPVNSVAYSPAGETALAAVGGGWLVLIADIEGAARDTELRWQPDVAFTAVAFAASPDAGVNPASYAISGSVDGTIILWDTAVADLSDVDDVAALLEWVRENRYVAAGA